MAKSWSGLRSVASRFIAALVVVFLLFAPYISNSLRDLSRYLHMWQRADMVVLLGIIVSIAAVATLIDEGLRRLGRPLLIQLYHHLFVLTLGAGILANVAFYSSRSRGWHIGRTGAEIQTLWLVLVAIVAYSFARPSSKLTGLCARLCLIVSPAVPIVALQLLTVHSYPLADDPLPAAPVVPIVDKPPRGDRDPPVYLFVFDEWSYERTFVDGRLGAAFPNLAELAANSAVFHDAYSPGEDTARSIPALLFQTDRPVAMKDGQIGFDCEGRIAPTSEFECLFSVVSDRNYRRIMIGAFLPYATWLGDQVDVCRSYCYYPRADSLPGQLAVHGFNTISYLTDPWSVLASSKLKTPVNDRQILKIQERMREDIFSVIRDQPANTFAVFHYLLPHEPFILNPAGTYRGPDDSAWVRPNVEGYTRNLACLDHLIGLFVDVMRQADRFEDALIILTSDHSWRFDPARKAGRIAAPVTHVPLLVKLPGQQEPISISDRFETRELGCLIRWAVGPDAEPSQLGNFVRASRQTAGRFLVDAKSGAGR